MNDKKTNLKKIRSLTDEELLLIFSNDWRIGNNVNNKVSKGKRSERTIERVVCSTKVILHHLQLRFGVKRLLDLEPLTYLKFVNELREGKVFYRHNGIKKPYGLSGLVKFNAFWRWLMRYCEREGLIIPDVTRNVDISTEKPAWVFIPQEIYLDRFVNSANKWYTSFLLFSYDTGARPQELLNIKVCDLLKEQTAKEDYTFVNIHRNIKKRSFERNIQLTLSKEAIKEFVKDNDLKPDDLLFNKKNHTINRYLKNLANKLFEDRVSKGRKEFKKICIGDIRHNACCYWLQTSMLEKNMKYRFGWKKSDKIWYYSEFLGLKGEVCETTILTDNKRTTLERNVEKITKENDMLKMQYNQLQENVSEIMLQIQTNSISTDLLTQRLEREKNTPSLKIH